MRLHRMLAILLLIESRGQMKAKELARALETSVRTIYRDIDALCESGIPLGASSGPGGGIYLMEGYQIDVNNLYADEVVNLYLSGIGIRPEGQTDAGVKLQSTLLKLEKVLPSAYEEDIKKARERFYYDEVPWWGKRAVLPYQEVVRKAVWQSKVLRIRYGRQEEGAEERKVHPYGMVVKNMEWYLVAYCEKAGEIRTFKCDRIQQAVLLEDSFQIAKHFVLKQYWEKQEEEFKRVRSDEEHYPVTIRVHSYDRDLLTKLEVIGSTIEGESILATVNMHKYEYACNEAMDIIGRASIVEPPALREYVKKRAQEIMLEYA